jgi:hypothetical protein
VCENHISCVKLSNNGLHVIASSTDGLYIKLIDLRKNEIVKIFSHD